MAELIDEEVPAETLHRNVLQRRLTYLEDKVAAAVARGQVGVAFDRLEIEALRWFLNSNDNTKEKEDAQATVDRADPGRVPGRTGR